MGRKPRTFPGKTDCHPKNGLVNWWEADGVGDENKKGERQEIKKELRNWQTK
jgi:hypothetical protein